MIGFRRASPAIAVLVTTVSLLGAPLAHASSPMHSSSYRRTIHAQERFRFTTGHLPCIRQAHPRPHVEDPLADINLG